MESSATADAIQKAKEETRAQIVAKLKELRHESAGDEWSVKRGVWNLAILAAEGRLDNKRRGNGAH